VNNTWNWDYCLGQSFFEELKVDDWLLLFCYRLVSFGWIGLLAFVEQYSSSWHCFRYELKPTIF